MDIAVALKDLEEQKAGLLEHIARLSQVRSDLLLPDNVARLRAELGNLESAAAKLRAEIVDAKGRAEQIVAGAEDTARQTVQDATSRADSLMRAAQTRAVSVERDLAARTASLNSREGVLVQREEELGRRITAFEGNARRFAAERKHLASLVRPFVEELER